MSKGAIARETDRRHVRSGHTWATLAQAVAQFHQKFFRDEYEIGDPHFGRALFQNCFLSISRDLKQQAHGSALIGAQFGIQSKLLSAISCEYANLWFRFFAISGLPKAEVASRAGDLHQPV
jgi:hypothetical protein